VPLLAKEVVLHDASAILPNRVYDLRDVGFNAFAGLMAIAASLALAWARRRGSSGQPDEPKGH
jgi:hypothetical protein